MMYNLADFYLAALVIKLKRLLYHHQKTGKKRRDYTLASNVH